MNRLRRYVRAWLGRHHTVVRGPYLRLPEWLGLAGFGLCMTGALLGYQTFVTPLSGRIGALSRETSELRRRTETTRVERQQVERETAAFAGAMENQRRFERERLRDARRGQLALIDEINALARKHTVKLTDTISFALTDRNDADGPPSGGGGRAIRSYPAFDVKFGVTGSYRNLRRFIQSLEQSRQFLLLQLLSLTPGDAGASGPAAAVGGGTAGPDELTVTLALTAYFRSDSEAAADQTASSGARKVRAQ